MKKLLAAAALSLLAVALPTVARAADTYNVDKGHSEVSFKVKHLLGKVPGRFNDFSGTIVFDPAKPETSSVEFAIKATSIDTANGDRDGHLRSADFFDVEKFPEITFKSSKVKPAGKDKYDVTGTLTLHGVSKEVTLPVSFGGVMTAKGRDGKESLKSGFETQVTLNRKDYGIVWNTVLDSGGTVLGDDVSVQIQIEATKPK